MLLYSLLLTFDCYKITYGLAILTSVDLKDCYGNFVLKITNCSFQIFFPKNLRIQMYLNFLNKRRFSLIFFENKREFVKRLHSNFIFWLLFHTCAAVTAVSWACAVVVSPFYFNSYCWTGVIEWWMLTSSVDERFIMKGHIYSEFWN